MSEGDKPEIVVLDINFEEYTGMVDPMRKGGLERMMLERAAQEFARRLIDGGFIVSRTTRHDRHERVRFHFEMAAVKPRPHTEREFRQAPVEELDQLAADSSRKKQPPRRGSPVDALDGIIKSAIRPRDPAPDPTGLSPAQKAALEQPKTPGSQWLVPSKGDKS